VANEDLGKLKIDKTAAFRPGARRRPVVWMTLAALVVIVIALLVSGVLSPRSRWRPEP